MGSKNIEKEGSLSCNSLAIMKSRNMGFGRGIESRVFFTMGPIASCSQIVRNDAVKRTNIQDAEKGGDNCRTMFLSRGKDLDSVHNRKVWP